VPPRRAANRFGGERGQGVAEVGLTERPAANTQRLGPAENASESGFGLRTNQHQVRVIVARRQEDSGDLDARMAGLQRLLRNWQINTDERVNVA
jgi:hypothetical protein